MTYTAVAQQRITEVERAIRPFIRWTPLVRTGCVAAQRIAGRKACRHAPDGRGLVTDICARLANA
ncbi:MAG: hypothetical protein QOJ15_11353 [Bradyrhizobium sp.]|nr:hypothetical protein [Bradyrhizobium sp.]